MLFQLTLPSPLWLREFGRIARENGMIRVALETFSKADGRELVAQAGTAEPTDAAWRPSDLRQLLVVRFSSHVAAQSGPELLQLLAPRPGQASSSPPWCSESEPPPAGGPPPSITLARSTL